jgi:isopentenyl diphosphate isomerase/L-lactate dehydrogenase-like FMN-dependent dehydrogenase
MVTVPNYFGRSVQGEAKLLLEQAAASGAEGVNAVFERWRKRLRSRRFSSSAALIREDRHR